MSVLRTLVLRIPGLAPGIFFFLLMPSAPAGVSRQLAEELFREQNWPASRAESLRALAEARTPSAAARARLLAAQVSLRLNGDRETAKGELRMVWNEPEALLETRSAAAYTLGLAEWHDRNPAAAFPALRFAFLNAREAPLFWRAGCSLYFFLKADRRLRRSEPLLWRAIQSSRDAWPLEVWRECRPRRQGGPAWASLPGRGVVAFYRSLIGPAIGSRCDLEPSCSEYFLHASRAHGLLGIPIMADRFIREPSVVSARHQPVTMPDGRIRYTDPLSDHDFWMKGKR